MCKARIRPLKHNDTIEVGCVEPWGAHNIHRGSLLDGTAIEWRADVDHHTPGYKRVMYRQGRS